MFRQESDDPKGVVNSLIAAQFALFGFILAFTFGMSGARYENVRNVMVDEANHIGTAILRADLYPDSVRKELRANFKKYLEARIGYYESVKDSVLWKKFKEEAATAAAALWARAAQQSTLPDKLVASNQMIPALNGMFDIATKREILLLARVPDVIVYMLFILALTISFIVGFRSSSIRRKDMFIVIGFALLSSMIIYITLDLGRPMRGLIKADMGQRAILELREMFSHE